MFISPILTGVITKVHEDLSGFVRASNGDRYRFYPDSLWGFESKAPQNAEQVVFELNTTRRTAKALRRLGLQFGANLITAHERWIPALVTGKGVVKTRCAPWVYLTLEQMQTRPALNSLVLVRVSKQQAGITSWLVAAELQSLPGEDAGKLTMALKATATEAAVETQAIDAQLSSWGLIQTEEKLFEALQLLRLRDAYTAAPPTSLLDATSDIAALLSQLGYSAFLAPAALLGIMRQQDSAINPALLSRPLLLEYARQHLTELPPELTQEACDELIWLHNLGVKFGMELLPMDALQRFNLEPEQQLLLWRAGVAVLLPPQVQLAPELLSSLVVSQLENYIRQRLTELMPTESAAAGQELQDLFRISRQRGSSVFTAELLHELPLAEEHRLALWLQGAPVSLPHTNFDPTSLTANQLPKYAEQWLKELPVTISEEFVPHFVRLWTLGKQKHLTIFSEKQLAGLPMEVACQLALWHAGLPVPLLPTELDPSTLTTAQFDEYAALRLTALNPVQTEAAAQEVLSLYTLSQQKRSASFSTTLLPGLKVAVSFRLPLWLAGIPHFTPSTPEVVALVYQLLKGDEMEQRRVPQLMARLVPAQLAEAVLEMLFGLVAPAEMPQLLPHLQFKNMPPVYGGQLEKLLEQHSDEVLLQWWLNGTLLNVPAHPVARQLLMREGDQTSLLLKFKKQAGSSVAMVLELRQQLLQGHLSPAATSLLDSLTAIVRAQGRSNWQVDYWARNVVHGLQNDTRTLPPVEQLAWWLKGIGSEPNTAMLQQLVPALEDILLSGLWQLISTPGARALFSAILPWVEREATGHWLQLTLQELKGRRAAFYSDACRTLYQKVLPRLSNEEQVQLWLHELSEQPGREVLQAYWSSGADAVERLLPELDAQTLAQLLPSLMGDLRLDSPLVEPVLKQLTKHGSHSTGCKVLREQLLTQFLPVLPVDRYLNWWLAGWAPEPNAAFLQKVITEFPVEQQRRLIHECSSKMLLAYGQLLLSELQPAPHLLREVAIRLHGRQGWDPTSKAVIDQLLAHLPALQQINGWLQRKLPDPSPGILLAALPEMDEAQRKQAAHLCDDALLLASGDLMQKLPIEVIVAAKYLVLELAARRQLTAGHEVATILLAELPLVTQSSWWLEHKYLPVLWNVIQHGLERTDQYLDVAQNISEQHLPELLNSLPSASQHQIGRLVEVFTQEFTWNWGKNSVDRTALLVSLAEELCIRFHGAPEQRRDYLLRLVQRSRSTRRAGYSSRLESFADHNALKRHVSLLAAALFKESELLECWQCGLVENFPLVSLSFIASHVAQSQQAVWLAGLPLAAKVPESVVQAWSSLGSLRSAPLESVRTVAVAHVGALVQMDLLRGIIPWLIDNLTAQQLEVLWIHGYPVPQPADCYCLAFAQRLAVAVHYGQQQRWQELPVGLAPEAEEVDTWLAEQYWEEEDQEQLNHVYQLLLAYHALAMVQLSSWDEMEDE